MIDAGIALLVALAGALLFGAAAIHKLRAPGEFVATFTEYRVLPAGLIPLTAVLVMAIEGLLAFGLIWAPTRGLSALVAGALLLLYAAAIGVNLIRGRRDIDCGCTLQHRPIGGWMVIRNVLLALLLVVLALPVATRPLGALDVVTILATLLAATLLYASADLLLGRAHTRPRYSMDSP